MLVHVKAWGDYEVLGQTIDDAVGEAFDKVAKALGLGYPGGPVISRLAAEGNPRAIHFPRAMMHSGDYAFSLSGLKTSVITYIEGENKAGRAINLPDLAASFEAAVIDVQVAKAKQAVEETGVSDFCVGGGVAANPQLREAYRKTFGRMGVRVTVPPLRACGDNGAMIALVALRSYKAGAFGDLSLDAHPNSKLGDWSSPEAHIYQECDGFYGGDFRRKAGGPLFAQEDSPFSVQAVTALFPSSKFFGRILKRAVSFEPGTRSFLAFSCKGEGNGSPPVACTEGIYLPQEDLPCPKAMHSRAAISSRPLALPPSLSVAQRF